jgi:hypothetical protein
MNGLAIGTNGATVINTGSSPVRTGAVTLGGNLILQLTSSDFRVGALSGAGSIDRTALSGTLNFSAPAVGYSGLLTTTVGTTNFNTANALAGGRYVIGAGTVSTQVNVTVAGALNQASGTVQAGSLNLNTSGALDGAQLNLGGGAIVTSTPGALGTGVLQLSAGELTLRGNGNVSFGGTVNVTLPLATPGTISAAQSGTTTTGLLTISALNLNDRQLNLISKSAGYGLAVASATTISGAVGSTIDNDMVSFATPVLQLNAGLTLTGTGSASIGQLGGAGPLKIAAPNGSVTLTGAPLPDFTSAVQITGGTVNLNTTNSFRNGTVLINGGTLNLGVANALDATPTSMVSGFLSANAANALFARTIPVSNGTLFSTAPNALNGAVINLTGGNVTATAPAALAGATINVTDSILALRADSTTAFNGSVVINGTNFSTVSVAGVTDNGPTGRLSIDSLTFGGQTLNVTGGDGHVFAVVNPVTLVGAAPTTVNTTAGDAIFLGALSGSGALVKNGQRTLTLDNGAAVATTTVNAGTLIVNGPFTTVGVTVGNATTAATLQLGGAGVNAPGNLTINNGLLRISKANPADAIPAASAIFGGANGNVQLDYAGFSTGTLAKNIAIDATAAPRTLTLSASSGSSAAQVSTFTYTGLVTKSGANPVTIVAQADSALDDGFGNLVRPPSRIVLAANQTFDVQHGGGIVIGKGTINASGPTPFGTSTAALAMSVMDSTVGGMVADGQSAANWSRSVTTNTNSPRKRLGAFFNPLGAASQTIAYQSGFSFAWNDATLPLYVITPPGNPAGAMANSLWNGMIVDPGSTLQINPGVQLDNILTTSGTSITATAPVYVGGGGTVRIASSFNETTYRSLATAKGLAGQVVVLDNTTLQSQTTGHHFDGVELRSGTYQTTTSAQALAGGFAVTPSPFDPTRLTSTLITDADLTLTGVGAANAFKLATGTTLAKSGAATLNVNGDQLHSPGSTLQAIQGTINLNTDAGSPGANNLSLNLAGGAANFNVTQHLAQFAASAGTARLASGPTTGSRALDATAVAVAGTGKLDLTNGRLIVDYVPGNSPITSIRQQIAAGYILSSTAAAAPTVFGLGYGEASDLLGPAGGAFGSETVDPSSVLVRYTKLGDANLDGFVDFNDLVRLAQNYNQATGALLWSQGDFTYDGNVDFNDLVKLAQNYNTATPAASFEQELQSAFAAVPEPTSSAWLAAGGVASLARRRRRRQI